MGLFKKKIKKSCNQEIPNSCRSVSFYTQQGVSGLCNSPEQLQQVAVRASSHVSSFIIVHLFLTADIWDVVECFMPSESFLIPVVHPEVKITFACKCASTRKPPILWASGCY